MLLCRAEVAIFIYAMVFTHCTILEFEYVPLRHTDTMVRTWNVVIAMTALRYVLFAAQPWYITFSLSIVLGVIEANSHIHILRTCSRVGRIFYQLLQIVQLRFCLLAMEYPVVRLFR